MSKSHFYNQIRVVVNREYNGERGVLKGNGVKGTVTARDLKQEGVFELDPVNKTLDINEASEASNVNLKKYKEAINSYKDDMKKAENIIRDNGRDGLSYEVFQLRESLDQLEDDVVEEMMGDNSSTGVIDL